MMPFCEWRRCKEVAVCNIDLKCDDLEPWLCKKHFNKLFKILGQGCNEDEDE